MDSLNNDERELLNKLISGTELNWRTPSDLSNLSFESHQNIASPVRASQSRGTLRIYGPNIPSHDARMDSAGLALINFQKLVTTAGAVRRGFKALKGRIREDITSLTQLRIFVPMRAGSVVFDFAPEVSPLEELNPNGAIPIFGENRTQFIDLCVKDTLDLLASAKELGVDADPSEFLKAIETGGPRLAKAVKDFALSIEQADFDIDLSWQEPTKAAMSTSLSRSDAVFIRQIIQGRELDVEPIELTGQLVTLSTVKAWQIEVAHETVVTLDASAIAGPGTHRFALRDQVKVLAIAKTKEFPGGGTTTTYIVKSISLIE